MQNEFNDFDNSRLIDQRQLLDRMSPEVDLAGVVRRCMDWVKTEPAETAPVM